MTRGRLLSAGCDPHDSLTLTLFVDGGASIGKAPI